MDKMECFGRARKKHLRRRASSDRKRAGSIQFGKDTENTEAGGMGENELF